MLTLKAEKRNPDEKAKKLRRDGFITGVLYGKEMKENVSLKFTEKDASAFIKNAKEGTQAYLELDGKNVDVLVKNIDFDPLTKKYMALDFQALVAGEIVSATVPIVYVNEDKVQGIFEAELSEVHYKADPAHLLDPIEIDLAALPQTTKTMYVKDLKLEEKGVQERREQKIAEKNESREAVPRTGVEASTAVKDAGKTERKAVAQKKTMPEKEKKPSIHERLEINKKIIQEKQGKDKLERGADLGVR